MATGMQVWSKTAASNASADSAVNWAEGQAPSSINDSSRGEMAAVAKWRDDNNGSLSGTLATATYSVTSNQVAAALTAGYTVAFQLGSDLPATALLNLDALGAKPLRPYAGTDFTGGEYKTGAVIRAAYFTSNSGEWVVIGAAQANTRSIVDAAITNAKLANMAASTLKGRATASTGVPEDVTLGAGLAMSSGALTLSQTLAPQGRITLTSGAPVLPADATAQSTVYYTPYIGNLIPIYNGASFSLTAFSELSMVMSGANFASGGIYDLFVASDSGTLRLGIGPVWSTVTAGSGARGTGAGTTELQMVTGILTNKVTMTLRYASGSTVSISANQATYVGSIYLDGTNSQVSCHVGYGQSRKYGIWNAYNRRPIILKAGDSTATWTYTTAVLRASRNDTTNSLTIFQGLPEETIDLEFTQKVGNSTANLYVSTGIGYNSTSSLSGFGSVLSVPAASAGPMAIAPSKYIAPPFIGINVATSLEKSDATGTTTWSGTEANMILTARYQG